MCFYDVCRDVVTFREMEEIEENLILPSFRKLRFVDINKPFWKKLMYRAFTTAQKRCDAWHDYEMDVTPYENSKPIYYEFTACPAAVFIAVRRMLAPTRAISSRMEKGLVM